MTLMIFDQMLWCFSLFQALHLIFILYLIYNIMMPMFWLLVKAGVYPLLCDRQTDTFWPINSIPMLFRFAKTVRLILIIKWRICAEQGDTFAKFLVHGRYSQNYGDIRCKVLIGQTAPHHGEYKNLKEID